MRRVSALMLLLATTASVGAAAQSSPNQPSKQEPSRFEEQVEVVGVTPVHGIGLPKMKVPSNVQVFTSDQVRFGQPPEISTRLDERAASVQISDAQGGTFQPDLLFRGFSASPLLGASEGLAVYQDGVRVNEPFGDTVNWDALPSFAVASINLMPGSNPMFGLNALGGAISIRTRNGFDAGGRRVSASMGSFGRLRIEADAAARQGSFGYYVAGALTTEEGWRDYSDSTVRRLFADVAWRGSASSVNVSVTAASNDLAGNGTVPADLLEADRSAVFTHPDLTDDNLAVLTVRATRYRSAQTLFESVGYVRRSGIDTFNGDAADGDDEDEAESDEDADGVRFDAVNNVSRTRSRGGGLTGQITRTSPLFGRDNHLIAGAGVDAASTRFDFASEFAMLTPSRGTTGSGIVDEESLVELEARMTTGGAFLTNTWSVTPRLTLSAAVRVNATSLRLRDRLGTALDGDHSFWRVNPAAGLTYQLERGVNVYGSYSESSRVPTPVELTCADPEDPCRLPNAFVSDPPLEQIVGRTWEAGVRRASDTVDWAVAAFTTAAADDIIFVSSGTVRGEGHFENVARTHRRGVEMSADVALGRVSAFAAYTVQRATFGTSLRIASPNHPHAAGAEIEVERGDSIPAVPAHTAKAGVSASVSDRVTLGTTIRAQSGRHFRGDEGNLLPAVPGFAVVDLRARLRLARRLTLVGHIANLFDAQYSTFGALGEADLLGGDSDDPRFYSPGAPRGAWVGVELEF
jgi:outer membrane receptor protein involved in Fe transport